jgi:hypothetical protein
MDSPFFLVLVGFLYIVLFGGLALMRREGLSVRFAVESIAVIGVFLAIGLLSGVSASPILFLLVLYLVTMRARLLVDVGIFFARRRNFKLAEDCYNLADHLGVDRTSRVIIGLNRGVTCIQKGELEAAIASLKSILTEKDQGFMGVKHEAAAHYNLGVAYLKSNQAGQASAEFHAVLDTWPTSEYARRAEAALRKNRPDA